MLHDFFFFCQRPYYAIFHLLGKFQKQACAVSVILQSSNMYWNMHHMNLLPLTFLQSDIYITGSIFFHGIFFDYFSFACSTSSFGSTGNSMTLKLKYTEYTSSQVASLWHINLCLIIFYCQVLHSLHSNYKFRSPWLICWTSLLLLTFYRFCLMLFQYSTWYLLSPKRSNPLK